MKELKEIQGLRTLLYAVIIMTVMAVTICLTGCNTTHYITQVQHDSVYVHHNTIDTFRLIKWDSIHVKDSTNNYVTPDGVHHSDRTLSNYVSAKQQSSHAQIKDSLVYIRYSVVSHDIKEVNKLIWWQKILMWIGGLTLMGIGGYFGIKKLNG